MTAEEFDALIAIDGSYGQRRPSPEMEARLRRLGLIEPSPLSRLPVRTVEGEALVASETQGDSGHFSREQRG